MNTMQATQDGMHWIGRAMWYMPYSLYHLCYSCAWTSGNLPCSMLGAICYNMLYLESPPHNWPQHLFNTPLNTSHLNVFARVRGYPFQITCFERLITARWWTSCVNLDHAFYQYKSCSNLAKFDDSSPHEKTPADQKGWGARLLRGGYCVVCSTCITCHTAHAIPYAILVQRMQHVV